MLESYKSMFFLKLSHELNTPCYVFQSYITCSIGIWNVGYVMICYGVVDAICSFSFGRLVQYVGHIPFFILGKSTERL